MRDWFAEAFESIRHELVERPWFGREVTPHEPTRPHDHNEPDRDFYGRDHTVGIDR